MLTFLSIKCLHFSDYQKCTVDLNALLKNNKLKKKDNKSSTHLLHNQSLIINTGNLILPAGRRDQPWIPFRQRLCPSILTARGKGRCLGSNSAGPSDKMVVPTSSCPIPFPRWSLTQSFTCFHLPSCQTLLVIRHPQYLNLLL